MEAKPSSRAKGHHQHKHAGTERHKPKPQTTSQKMIPIAPSKEMQQAAILKKADAQDVGGIYRAVYPYNHLNGEKVKHFTETIEQCLTAQDLIQDATGFFSGFDALSVALRFLQDSLDLELTGCSFVDCCGCCGT